MFGELKRNAEPLSLLSLQLCGSCLTLAKFQRLQSRSGISLCSKVKKLVTVSSSSHKSSTPIDDSGETKLACL